MDINQLAYILSNLTPENKPQILKLLQLQAAQTGEPLSPELTAFFNAAPGQEGQAWDALLKTLGPKESPTGYEGLKQSLLGRGPFGIQPHMSSLENIMRRLNSPGGFTGQASPGASLGNARSSGYLASQRTAQQPKGYFQQGVNTLGNFLQDTAESIGVGAAGALGGNPLGFLATPVAFGLGQYASNYGNNPNLRGINPTYGL